MKAICICTTGRLDRVTECLKSIRENNLDGWTLFASMEPGYEDVHSAIRAIDFIPVVSWINGRRLGPELNTFTVQWSAISENAESVLYFDDDMVLSPDAVQLCNWYLSKTELLDPQHNAGICLCSRNPNDSSRPDSVSPNDTWQGLVGQGYCFTRDQWFNFVKRNFWVYRNFFGGDGYDWALGHMAVHLNKIIFRPRLSRSKHTGRNGFHGDNVDVFPDVISSQKDTRFILEDH